VAVVVFAVGTTSMNTTSACLADPPNQQVDSTATPFKRRPFSGTLPANDYLSKVRFW